MIEAPRIRFGSRIDHTFIETRVSPFRQPFATIVIGRLPIRIAWPCARAVAFG